MAATKHFERILNKEGHHLVCGIDEVGRGSLAGPMVAASVILPADWDVQLNDSKLLSAKKRSELYEIIIGGALAAGIGWVSNQEIDRLGLTRSVRLAYLRALEDMDCGFSIAIIDGNYDYLSDYGLSKTIVAADSKISCVAAASIIAKVSRDNYMLQIADKFGDYGFQTNVGYGTKKHVDAILKKGLSSQHRKSFCKKYL